MAVNYLHGVETIVGKQGERQIRTVRTAVVGLVGTAPSGPINMPTVISSDTAAAVFGPATPGFTIPQAIDAIFDQGAGTIIVINVCDPAIHKTAVTNEAKSFGADNTLFLDHHHPVNIVVKNSDLSVTYVLGDDYTVDPETRKVIRKVTGAITGAESVKISYNYTDPTEVEAADVIGTVSVGGIRSGMKALEGTYNLFGFEAKIIIAPVYCTQLSVSTEMIVQANKLNAITLIDAPIGTTPAQAIAGRGPSGVINFYTSSDRAILCYPHLKVFDTITKTERLEPFSQRLAGVICRKDVEDGFWWSPSNTEIQGITGLERPLTARLNDPQSEVNQLNEVGIMTVFSSYGTGFLTWGNRNASFPVDTGVDTFISIKRVGDVLDESIEFFSQPYMDRPINEPLIDDIKGGVNGYIRELRGRGALIGGECLFLPQKNPATEIAAGHLTFSRRFIPPPPLERLSHESYKDVTLLNGLLASRSS